MRRIKLKVSYDGTNYLGWQRQNDVKTIQEEIEKCLKMLTGENICLHGSGRTDTGVHALCQVAHFDTDSRIEDLKFTAALNARLPLDIRVIESREVDEEFHSRFSAKRKHYRYTINNAPIACPFQRNYQAHVYKRLNYDEMEKAARLFEGRHDFAAFKNIGAINASTERTVFSSLLTKEGSLIYYDIIGGGFLYNMVRIIAGTLIAVGTGKLKVSQIPDILNSGDRSNAPATAPAHGLTLVEVSYDEH